MKSFRATHWWKKWQITMWIHSKYLATFSVITSARHIFYFCKKTGINLPRARWNVLLYSHYNQWSVYTPFSRLEHETTWLDDWHTCLLDMYVYVYAPISVKLQGEFYVCIYADKPSSWWIKLIDKLATHSQYNDLFFFTTWTLYAFLYFTLAISLQITSN